MHHEPAVPAWLFVSLNPWMAPEDFSSCVFAQTTLLKQGLQERALPAVPVAWEPPAIQGPFQSFGRNSNLSSAFLFLWQTGLKEGDGSGAISALSFQLSAATPGEGLGSCWCHFHTFLYLLFTPGKLLEFSLNIKRGQAAPPAQALRVGLWNKQLSPHPRILYMACCF